MEAIFLEMRDLGISLEGCMDLALSSIEEVYGVEFGGVRLVETKEVVH
jgi:hypothetical protein